jgi:uncharacterized protein (UPF0332 family)
MSFKWRNYHELAKNLAIGSDEAHWRSAISRAYYAVFNIIRLQVGYNIKGAELTHIQLIQNLKANLDAYVQKFPCDIDLRHIGELLDSLRLKRNKADYEGAEKISQRQALDAVQIAEQIINEIAECNDN